MGDLPVDGRVRPVVVAIHPDAGRTASWPVDRTRVVGEPVQVVADVVVDGHDHLRCWLRWRRAGDGPWGQAPMVPVGNDRYEASVCFDELGRYELSVRAAVDRIESWAHAFRAIRQAGQPWDVEALAGADLLADAAARCEGPDATTLRDGAERLRRAAERPERGAESGDLAPGLDVDPGPGLDVDPGPGLDLDTLVTVAARHPDLRDATEVSAGTVWVDRPLAGASAWYELFPRSASPDPTRAGRLADVTARLPGLAALGFDIVYLPPIHPIGRQHRKGRNGAVLARPDDPGSPWAIGGPEGGHDAIHPDLGDLDDLAGLVEQARGLGMEVALDLALQCSPDHPWVTEHPAWFRHRPDGTIACAENPPKRYEDVYPLDFETADWRALWLALADVVDTWIDRGITVFRVDNPHTKPVRFWRWLIERVHQRHPEVLFLAEAFTRPRMMELLAAVGFSQSYTYFTWREQKWEIEQYLAELATPPVSEWFRPCFWPNTPDILPRHLHGGQRSTFVARLVLAATASACYGVYGPAYELMVHEPREPGSEEYRDSEKYEVRHWDLDRPDSLAPVYGRLNAIRRRHPALRQSRGLRLQRVDNDQLVAFVRTAPQPPADPGDHGPVSPWPTAGPAADGSGGRPAPWAPGSEPVGDAVLVVVNLDPVFRQTGWVELDLDAVGIPDDVAYEAHDLLTDQRFRWQGPRNFVALDPADWPAHVLHLHPVPGDR